MIVTTKKQGKVTLDDSNYKAGGGEGAVYIKGDTAFKIYHDAGKMLPIAKIGELSVLSGISNIITPDEVIYDQKGVSVGYTMKYVKDCEFLCKIFTKSFRDNMGVTPNDAIDLVKSMQDTLNEIHAKNVIVGDYNEMNFLLDKSLKIPYHIDVDSWQTPSYKCTAIMPTVQDMTRPMGYFDENTDWYSWAVVTFQILIGIHPYKGRHPNYKAKDFTERVKKNISVFNSDVEIPTNCQNFSVIPKIQLDWYKEVFEKGYRGVPPQIGLVSLLIPTVAKIIKSSDAFEVSEYFTTTDKIGKIFNFKENLYIFTKGGFIDFQTGIKKDVPGIIGLCEVLNENPVIVKKDNEHVIFEDYDGKEIGRIASSGGFFSNGACYVVNNGSLIENRFERLGKVQHISRPCDRVSPYSSTIHDGLITQDGIGKISLVIPYSVGHSINIRIPEMDGYNILDAKYESNNAILICEKSGTYYRFMLTFNKDFKSYSVRKDDNIDYHEVNFVVLPNGVVINAYSDEKIELFQVASSQTKEVIKPPFNSSTKMYTHMGKLIFVEGVKIKKCSLKK